MQEWQNSSMTSMSDSNSASDATAGTYIVYIMSIFALVNEALRALVRGRGRMWDLRDNEEGLHRLSSDVSNVIFFFLSAFYALHISLYEPIAPV